VSRRVSLPGADELFRTTTTLAAVPSQSSANLAPVADDVPVNTPLTPATKKAVRQTPRRRVNSFDRSTSGRERHDEKLLFISLLKSCTTWNKLD